jgi:predicted dehydrogenase
MAAPVVLENPPAVVLIGGGFIGPVHAEALRRIGVRVVGLLGSSPERAAPLAQRLGIPRVYRDLDDLLSDTAVQAVHIASPNAHHFDQAAACLEAGKHVLCEKPLAISSEQTADLCRRAALRTAQQTAVNYNVRFYSFAHEMRSRVASGDVGEILSVTGSYTQDWLLFPDDYNWRVEPDGGTNLRAVADIGTHWMDLAQFVTGIPILEVFAELSTFHPVRKRSVGPTDTFAAALERTARQDVTINTEDFGVILLRFPGAARGAFHVSQTFPGRKNRLLLEVAGAKGSLTWNSERPDELIAGWRDRPSELVQRDPAQLGPHAAAISHYPGGHAEGFPDSFKQLFLTFYGAIETPTLPKPYPTFDDGHREVVLCEAIARSAREHRFVSVES